MPTPALVKRFADPDKTFGPTPLWWWSGDEVTEERISWQLEQFNAGGLHNLVIINLAPRGPLYGGPADQPAWFSERWWDLFGHTCEVAERLDMKIWFYDQLGFSGANIPGSLTRDHPWAAGQRLIATPLPELALDTVSPDSFVTAFDDHGHRYALDDLSELKARAAAVTVVSIRRTSFDYLNPDATALLFDYVHGEFERRLPHYLGTVIPGSFQDELPPTNSWTPALPDAFAERHGYDLMAELPALFTPGDDRAAKIRTDYFAVRTELAEDAFFRPIAQWHEKYQMLLGADQSHPARSGWPTQGTQLYSDYFRTHRWYNAVGSDHNGDAKVHSSMANLYGHSRVWMESFHSSGWGGTLEETYDWLIPFVRSGADLYNPHATYFGTYGGWFEWAPPSTDWRQPYWTHYPRFSGAVSRLCSVANWGRHVAEVAVLHPATVTQAEATLDTPTSTAGTGNGMLGAPYEAVDRAQQVYIRLCGVGNWFNPQPGALDAAGVSFDVIDDASIQAAAGAGTDDDALTVRDQAYRTVVLPAATVLEPDTARALIDLLDRNGMVITVGARPRMISGLSSDDSLLERLNGHTGLRSVETVEEAVTVLRDRDSGPRSDVPLLVRTDGDQYVALITGAWPSATEHLASEGMWTQKSFDRSRYAQRRQVRIGEPVDDVEIWDPATGERRPATADPAPDGGWQVDVELGGAPAVYLVWRRRAADTSDPDPAATPPLRHLHDLTDWTGELVPTLDNTWGDLARPVGADLDRLQVWPLEWAETPAGQPAVPDESAWAPTRVTFGQRARSHGPVPAASAPPPLTADEAAAVLRGDHELADASWDRAEWSASRGREREVGQLGNKSLVYEEFVHTDPPAADEVAVVRAVIGDVRAGTAELVIGAAAAKRIWWNGAEVIPAEQDYYAVGTVDVRSGGNVLEYRLGPSQRKGGRGNASLGSFFTLADEGSFVRSPLFITDEPVDGPTPLSYRKEFEVGEGVTSGRLIVGSHGTATVRIDDRVVAVQARTELYEDLAGDAPRFFEHDVGSVLTPGRHRLQIDVESFPGAEYAYADLAVCYADDQLQTVSSDRSWTVVGREGSRQVRVLTGHWGELASARAARRPHPLPGAEWMRGPAEVGGAVLPTTVSDRASAVVPWYRITLPAGARRVRLPVADDGAVEIVDDSAAGARYAAGELIFDRPLAEVTKIVLRLQERRFRRAGAAWAGPLEVTTEPAPIRLGSWHQLGLSSWSGGVGYRCTVDPAAIGGAGDELVLHLGDVRGTAEVLVDSEPVGDAFCAPFRFSLGQRSAPFELTVLIFNTLGPFLYESTPTRWVMDGQLESGLFGPVTLSASAGD